MVMRIWCVVLAALAVLLLLAGAASAEVFVIGPGMLGSPADDPMVGYSALELDLDTVFPGAWYVYGPSEKDQGLRPPEKAERGAVERPRS